MRALAVDPGGVTGVALYGGEDGGFASYELGTKGDPDYETTVWHLNPLIAQEWDALVCEGFVIRGNTHKLDSGAFSHTTDLIGACRLLAWENGVTFVRQTPAQAKSFATDDKLRRLGWYNRTEGGHANDAARHLLTYLAGVRYAPVLKKLTGDGR